MGELRGIAEFEERTERFERVVAMVISSTVIVAGVVAALVAAFVLRDVGSALGASTVTVVAGVALLLSLRGQHKLAVMILTVGGHSLVCVTTMVGQRISPAGVFAFIVFPTIAAFLLHPKATLIMVGTAAVAIPVASISSWLDGTMSDDKRAFLITAEVAVPIVGVLLHQFSSHARSNLEAYKRRLSHNEALFDQVPDAARSVGDAARQLLQLSRGQHDSSLRQAESIEKTRRVFQGILESSEEIVTASQEAIGHAGATLGNTGEVTKNVDSLSGHTERIAEILDRIRELSNRSDLLALNAALEGVHAGEKGRGFALVAERMQRLAEATAAAAEDIDQLTDDIGAANRRTLESTAQTQALAEASTTTNQRIARTVEMQQDGVGAARSAMDDVAAMSRATTESFDEVLAAAQVLEELAKMLLLAVERFQDVAE